MPEQEEKTVLVFPELPEVVEHSWVNRLPADAKAQYLRDYAAITQQDRETLAERIRTLPGFESVPEEAVLHLAHRWAITLANTFSEGKESGIKLEKDLTYNQRMRDHHYRLNAQDAVPG